MEIRPLDPTDPRDHERARALGVEAFGEWPSGSTPPPRPTEPEPGRRTFGAFDGDRLAAKVVWHAYESWWGGQRVPTAGIAGVAVAAEHRGAGLLAPLFEVVLAEAREAGCTLSTLFPTATGIYRSLGYELVTSLDEVTVPVAELGRVRRPTGVTTRRATVEDVPAIRAVHDRWAAAQNGPLTRTGPHWAAETDEQLLGGSTGFSLAVDQTGAVLGYAAWSRGTGYGPDRTLHVDELLALSADAYRALWIVVGSFGSVTGTVRLSTSGADPARLVLPTATWDVVSRHAYMLAVLDDAAFTARGVTLPGEIGLSPQGRALLYAGAQNCANLRMLGHLTGPEDHDAALDAALAGRPLHVCDYF